MTDHEFGTLLILLGMLAFLSVGVLLLGAHEKWQQMKHAMEYLLPEADHDYTRVNDDLERSRARNDAARLAAKKAATR